MMHEMGWGKVTLIFSTTVLMLGGCLSETESSADLVSDQPTLQNGAPTISGNPQGAVTIGGTYSFTPTASDPDGDNLTFSVENLPAWASFDSTTGQISGQPSLANVNVFNGIVISVSDGINTTSMSGYSITVSQAALGSMTLSWTPPTANTDGTTLMDLDGYRVYFGNTQGSYPNRVAIDNASISTYVVENLVPDTYYVVATSVNSAGVESAYSNVAIKVVQ